jgi:hypothetical protein
MAHERREAMTQTEPEETTQPVEEEEATLPDEDSASERGRSEITFPYGDLADAEAVAKALHACGGNSVPQDRLAAELQSTVKSSGFRTKVATAKVFGVVQGRGDLTLTPLGHELVDASKAADARVKAFLSVPLFSAIFEAHKGQVLPPQQGLENEIARLGVPEKQKVRARQNFQRSAKHAGFFAYGADRLVSPGSAGPTGNGDGSDGKQKERKPRVDGQRQIPAALDPILSQLLDESDDWPEDTLRAVIKSARQLRDALPDQE